ncbi:MAG: lipocalin family protein [Bacteroidales bacterium]
MALSSVDQFSLDKFLGKWYVVSRLPNKFDKDLCEITVTYEYNTEGELTVVNEGRLNDDVSRIRQSKGRVLIEERADSSKFKVSYIWPFMVDSWVLKIAPDYSYALVGEPSGKFLRILSRERTLSPKIIEELKNYAGSLGFTIENMVGCQLD